MRAFAALQTDRSRVIERNRAVAAGRSKDTFVAEQDAFCLKCHSPDAGMFMMLDVRGTGLSSGDFACKLYDATGVAVLDATAFGRSGPFVSARTVNVARALLTLFTELVIRT